MAAITLIIGTSTTVHARADHSGTACGAEFRKGRYGVGQHSKVRETDLEVTCKTCLRKVAALPTPAQITVQAARKETIRVRVMEENRQMYRRTCACCQQRIRGTREEISAHSAACWTAAKARR